MEDWYWLLIVLLAVLLIVTAITGERDLRKLEEKIAETKDAVIQKRLQELLGKRKKEEKRTRRSILILMIIVALILSIFILVKGHIERKNMQLELEKHIGNRTSLVTKPE